MISLVFCINAISWIINVRQGSVIDGVSKKNVAKSQHKVLQGLKKIGIYEHKMISHVANLIKVEFPDSMLEKVEGIEGVREVQKSVLVRVPEPFSVSDIEEENIFDNHDITKVKSAWSGLGVSGNKVKVGIVDTGIDYTHSAFRNKNGTVCVGNGCRIIECYDFTGEQPDCLDSLGHGTHVAGIVGGLDDTIHGVAPNVVYGSYKVFKKGAKDEDYFQVYMALDQAYQDGMQVINLSLGLPSGWDGGIIESIYAKLEHNGVIVVNSNGNSGSYGLFMSGSPGVSKHAFAVAAFRSFPNGTYIPTTFTSWGPGPKLQIKPEIGGPGQAILSAIPNTLCPDKPCYARKSGTSMSSPYIAGVAALFVELYKTNVNFTSRAMQTSSPSMANANIAYSVLQQGSGMVDAFQLLSTTTVIEPNKLELGAVGRGTFKSIKISNNGATDVTYSLSNLNALSVRGFKQVEQRAFHHTLSMIASVTIPSGKSKTLRIYIYPDSKMMNGDGWVFSGYVILTGGDGKKLFVPYAGYKGNYQERLVFQPQSPSMVHNLLDHSSLRYSTSPVGKESGTITTNFTDENSVNLWVSFQHPVEALQIQVISKKTNTSLGITHYEKNIRNYDGEFEDLKSSHKTYNFTKYFENGQYCEGCYATDKEMTKWLPIVDGEYYFKMIAQKPLGNVYNKNHYTTWTSPVIRVRRGSSK
eukprot:NODE_30_length_32972_cov_0.541052.p2 type:complete len:695 gc:universal NODE_30_length_32972_cov_0.541052:8439-6355(-)